MPQEVDGIWSVTIFPGQFCNSETHLNAVAQANFIQIELSVTPIYVSLMHLNSNYL